MRFQIITLVDVTETGARRGDDDFLAKQQANYMTMLQTVGLRVNPIPLRLEQHEAAVSSFGFGERYDGKHCYWIFEFTTEHEGAITTEMMQQDFDLIPVITGLNETIKLNKSVFRTKDHTERNIIFNCVD